MKLVTILLSILVMALARPLVSMADSDSLRTLTMKEAISMALENNHHLKASSHNARSSSYSTDIATSRYYPNLFFEESFGISNSPTQTFMMKLDQGRFSQNDFQIHNLNHPGSWRNFKTALTLTQSLYDPSISPSRAMARQEALKAEAGYEGAQQDLAFQVFVLYLDSVRAAAQLKAIEQALADATENVRLARVREREGVGLKSDLLRAETHRAMVEQHLITARNSITLIRLRMALAVGAGEGSLVEVAEPGRSMTPTCAIEELFRVALQERRDLRQSQADKDRGDAALRLARNAYLPTLDAFGSYQFNSREYPFGSDNDAWMTGVSLKWQIFDGFRRCSERKRVLAGRSAAEEELIAKTDEIKLQIRESCLRRDEAAKQRDVARQALASAEETVRLLGKRYENSLATMLDLLDAQTALNQSRSKLVDAEADYAFSGGRVFHASGMFLKEIMK
ncbi:MAG: TolC family protein [Desulfuromonadales bacterium]|nr:TolC family protein [Desulfuromonadales bacterium]